MLPQARVRSASILSARIFISTAAPTPAFTLAATAGCSLKFAAKSNLAISSGLDMSGQLPGSPPGSPPGSLDIAPQLTRNGAASPAKTIGQETCRQLLRVIVILFS